MRKALLIAGAAVALWAMYVRKQSKGDGLAWAWDDGTTLDWLNLAGVDTGLQSAGAAVGGAVAALGDGLADLLGGSLKLSNMKKVTAADVAHPNVRAFAAVIRAGEGTADADGYRRIFGGELFDGFADHPRKRVTKTFRNGKTVTSTAAGVGQFLASTWDETKRYMQLPDFSPESQDKALVGRIAARGALEDVKAGRFEVAVKKVAKEWASMPGSPYGQPVITMAKAHAAYAAAGGGYA